MKRVSIIALAIALLLCGCGSAPAQPVSAAAPSTHEADAAVSPEIIEEEPEVYDSARDFLRSLYDESAISISAITPRPTVSTGSRSSRRISR